MSLPLALQCVVLLAAPDGGWLSPHRVRQQVVLSAFDAGVAPGYSVSVTFDHASEVDAGRSRADGLDVRVERWTGAGWQELDRVLDTGSGWNLPTTTLWFATPTALGPDGVDDDSYLFWGGAPLTPAREDPDQVFLFADGFETGTTARWTASTLMPLTDFRAVSGIAHSGTFALRQRVLQAGEMQLGITSVTLPPDVMVDAWHQLQAPQRIQNGYIARFALNGDKEYVLRFYGANAPLPWDIAWRDSGSYNVIGSRAPGALLPGVWRRVGFGTFAQFAASWLDGVPLRPDAGVLDVGNRFSSGTVGLARVTAANEVGLDGGSDWLIDDVRVRRWVFPEPVAVLASPVKAAGEGCSAASQCLSGQCVLGRCWEPAVVPGSDAGPESDAGSSPDGGAPGPIRLQVGCGCSGQPGLPWWPGLVLLGWAAARRRAAAELTNPNAS